MATIEGVRRDMEQRKMRLEGRRNRALEAYGPELGTAYFYYAENVRNDESEVSSLDAFAEAIVQATETGTHEDKVMAVKAVLAAVESRLETVAANARSDRYVRY